MVVKPTFHPFSEEEKIPDKTTTPQQDTKSLELEKAKGLLELEVSTIQEAIRVKNDYIEKSASLNADRQAIEREKESQNHERQILEVVQTASARLSEIIQHFEELSVEAAQVKARAETQLAGLEDTIRIRHQTLCSQCQTRQKTKCDKCYHRLFCVAKIKDYDKWLVKYKRNE